MLLVDIVCNDGETLVFVAVTTNLNWPVEVAEEDGKSPIIGTYNFGEDEPEEGFVIVPVALFPFASNHCEPL